MIGRREFITLLGGAAVSCRSRRARSLLVGRRASASLHQVGNLRTRLFAAFRQEMRRLGYVEGHNLILEFRSAAKDADRLPELAAELVRLPVDIMVVEATAAARAAK